MIDKVIAVCAGAEMWVRGKLRPELEGEWGLEPPHHPAHGRPYFASDGDIWFIAFATMTGIAGALLLPADVGFCGVVSAAVAGAALGVMIRIAWSARGQDHNTTGGRHGTTYDQDH